MKSDNTKPLKSCPIQEMAEVIKSSLVGLGSGNFNFTGDEISAMFANALYNAGYRKQSGGEWEDANGGKYANPIYRCSLCEKGTLLKPHINELGNMEMVQALSSFCPHCGAKMKGGDGK